MPNGALGHDQVLDSVTAATSFDEWRPSSTQRSVSVPTSSSDAAQLVRPSSFPPPYDRGHPRADWRDCHDERQGCVVGPLRESVGQDALAISVTWTRFGARIRADSNDPRCTRKEDPCGEGTSSTCNGQLDPSRRCGTLAQARHQRGHSDRPRGKQYDPAYDERPPPGLRSWVADRVQFVPPSGGWVSLMTAHATGNPRGCVLGCVVRSFLLLGLECVAMVGRPEP